MNLTSEHLFKDFNLRMVIQNLNLHNLCFFCIGVFNFNHSSWLFADAFSKAHERMKTARENALMNLKELSLDETTTLAAEEMHQQ